MHSAGKYGAMPCGEAVCMSVQCSTLLPHCHLQRQSEVIKAMLDGDDEGVVLALCQSDVSQRTAKADVSVA